MSRLVTSALAVVAVLATAPASANDWSTAALGQSGPSEAQCTLPLEHSASAPAMSIRATSFSDQNVAYDAQGNPRPMTDFERRQAMFEQSMPGAPSLQDTGSSSAAPQYEQRSATNPFPYPENATGRAPSGALALYHVGIGTVGSDVIKHPETVGLPTTFEYNIPHLPQEEPLWCWAAAAQQAIGWVNKGYAPTQCAIVALAHGIDVEKCCADRDGICARTGEIPSIARLVSLFGGQAYELASVPRKPREIYDIVSKGQTLLIRLRPAPHDQAAGIRHMIVVRGIEWELLPNRRLGARLLYNDPLGSGIRAVSFDSIVGFFEQALIVRRNS